MCTALKRAPRQDIQNPQHGSLQETQADSVEELAESAGGEPQSADKPETGPHENEATSVPAKEGTTRPPVQHRSVQELYGQHLPRQMWQLPGSRLSIGGQQVAGGGGPQQPLVLLPHRQGSTRQQGLAVLPGSFAAQALSSRGDRSPRDASEPPAGDSLFLISVLFPFRPQASALQSAIC